MDFKKIIESYTTSTDAIIEFIDLTNVFDKTTKKIIEKDPIALIPLVIKSIEEELYKCNYGDKNYNKLIKDKKKMLTLCKKSFDYKCDKDGKIGKLSAKNYTILKNTTETLKKLAIKFRSKEFIFYSTLMNLVSIFHKLLSDIIHIISELHPERLKLDDDLISFNDLKNVKKIDEAKDIILSRKIDSLLYEGIEDHFKFIEDSTGLKFDFLEEHMEGLKEIIQRRNIFVHNDGIVNNQYLEKVDKKLIKKFSAKKNEKLKTNKDYLRDSINLFEAVGVYMTATIWKNFEPKKKERSAFLNDHIVYPRLLEKRNFVAEHIAEFIINDKNAKATIKDCATLNRWLAIKQDGRFKKIEKEVEEIDFSSREKTLQLGLLALLDNKKQFFILLPKCIKSKELAIEEYKEFPIFEKMRKTKESKDFLEKHNKPKKVVKVVKKAKLVKKTTTQKKK